MFNFVVFLGSVFFGIGKYVLLYNGLDKEVLYFFCVIVLLGCLCMWFFCEFFLILLNGRCFKIVIRFIVIGYLFLVRIFFGIFE